VGSALAAQASSSGSEAEVILHSLPSEVRAVHVYGAPQSPLTWHGCFLNRAAKHVTKGRLSQTCNLPRPLTAKTGVSSPLGSANDIKHLEYPVHSVSNKCPIYGRGHRWIHAPHEGSSVGRLQRRATAVRCRPSSAPRADRMGRLGVGPLSSGVKGPRRLRFVGNVSTLMNAAAGA
jgi:hypothetical protein